MNLLFALMVSIPLTLLTAASVHAQHYKEGPLVLQNTGNAIMAKTWRMLIVAETNIILLSLPLYYLMTETWLNVIIVNPLGHVISFITFFSLLSTLAILVNRGHLQFSFRSANTMAQEIVSRIEETEDPLVALKGYLQLQPEHLRVSNTPHYHVLKTLSERDDELGILARERFKEEYSLIEE